MGVIRKDANDPAHTEPEDTGGAAIDGGFESLVVLQFRDDVKPATVEWLLGKIEASRFEGGAELLARTVLNEKGQECIIHISSTPERLLYAAETYELKKKYRDGTLREVTVSDVHCFVDGDDLDSFFTMAEKQRLIKELLESLRASDTDKSIPGYQKQELYKGEAVVPKLLNLGILESMFPLHDREALKRLAKDWYQVVNILKPQPIDDIHRYFGETIAMYFAFLGYYTMALMPSALIGVLTLFIAPTDDVSLRIFFAVFNLIWATLFLEAWKRTSATLAYNWGTMNVNKFEQARGAYYGQLGVNVVTGALEPKYPKWKRRLKFYGVTVPLLIVSLIFSIVLMLIYFHYQHRVEVYYAEDPSTLRHIISILPSITYSIVVVVLSLFYRHVARYLNDWENHRLQSAYENHLITKLVLFDFFNSFMCLFYIAFYMKNMTVLRQSVASLLLTSQVINQVMESLVPYLLYKRRKNAIKKHYKHEAEEEDEGEAVKSSLSSTGGELDRSVREFGQVEASKGQFEESEETLEKDHFHEKHDSTIEDYLEMFLQFGYVFLFSAAFPTAAVWALLNNITEIRSDAFKMCRIFQRPFSQPAAGIGAWQGWFEGMTVLAVMTNCGLILLNPKIQEYSSLYGEVKFILLFVLAEHVILAVKWLIAFMIPDEPKWVQIAMAKVDYQAKQAWINQRLAEAKRSEHLLKRPVVEDLSSSPIEKPETS